MLRKLLMTFVFFSLTITIVASPTPDSFMNALSGNMKLKDLSLLGAHDAGTYALYPNMGISPDEYGNFIYKIGNTPILGSLINSTIVHAWSVTQTNDITGQLDRGVRYFDLRFAPDKNGQFRICHGLFGPLLTDIMSQINSFLNAHPQEIVLLDFTFFDAHGQPLDGEQQNYVFGQINQVLGNKIASSNYGLDVTLGQLWQDKKQAIIFWKDLELVILNNMVWYRNSCLVSTWYNKADWLSLMLNLNQGLVSRPKEMFYVNQAVLTPDANMIFCNLTSSLLAVEANTNANVLSWFYQVAMFGLAGNILMIDNVDTIYSQIFNIMLNYNLTRSH